ncbi:DUF2793 domain-containing protein [Parvularcula sp. LCG005]|uniref:DUF2793 domain-containing protein n=1 Tax=Parvularcula sp. LCG005 TaxID=3078805 RepID=UPI0029439EB7|nr:DUF2793 domain-containing protein [Parvularcula sp. LCG005]WOI54293.1 DUF2793 domain-containing protein [Parvularcula sp. LCG005]
MIIDKTPLALEGGLAKRPADFIGGLKERGQTVLQHHVVTSELSTPPESPAHGDKYRIGPSATGVWEGHESKLGVYIQDGATGQWEILAPVMGWTMLNLDGLGVYFYTGSEWFEHDLIAPERAAVLRSVSLSSEAGYNVLAETGLKRLNTSSDTALTLSTAERRVIEVVGSAAATITIPADADDDIPDNARFFLYAAGDGVYTIRAASGVSLNYVSGGGCTLARQFEGVWLWKRATNNWVVAGAVANIDGETAVAAPAGADVEFVRVGASTSRSISARAEDDPLVPADFASSTPGMTDVNAAVNAAAGKRVALPPAEYAGTAGILASGKAVDLRGSGFNSILRRTEGSASGAVNFISSSYDVRLHDLKVALDEDLSVSSLNLVNWTPGYGVEMAKIELDASVTETSEGSATRNYLACVTTLSGSATERNGFILDQCRIQNVGYVILKANTTVSTERRLRMTFNEFSEVWTVPGLFNSPAAGSLIDDILVLGNTLHENFGELPHRGSFAGNVHNGRVIANRFTVNTRHGEFWRMEEEASNHIFAFNTGEVGDNHGFEFTAGPAENNGTEIAPSKTLFIGNVVTGGGVADHYGIAETIGSDGLQPGLVDSIIANNIFENFEVALGVRTQSGRKPIHHNIGLDCDALVRVNAPSMSIHDNYAIGPSGLRYLNGGILGAQHFRAKWNAWNTVPTISVTNGRGGLTGWTVEAQEITIPDGSPLFELMPMGQSIVGELMVSIQRKGGTHFAVVRGRVRFDKTKSATSVYWSEISRDQTGSVIPSGSFLGIKNGNLAFRIFNGSGGASTHYNVQAQFVGLHTFPVVEES